MIDRACIVCGELSGHLLGCTRDVLVRPHWRLVALEAGDLVDTLRQTGFNGVADLIEKTAKLKASVS